MRKTGIARSVCRFPQLSGQNPVHNCHRYSRKSRMGRRFPTCSCQTEQEVSPKHPDVFRPVADRPHSAGSLARRRQGSQTAAPISCVRRASFMAHGDVPGASRQLRRGEAFSARREAIGGALTGRRRRGIRRRRLTAARLGSAGRSAIGSAPRPTTMRQG